MGEGTFLQSADKIYMKFVLTEAGIIPKVNAVRFYRHKKTDFRRFFKICSINSASETQIE